MAKYVDDMTVDLAGDMDEAKEIEKRQGRGLGWGHGRDERDQ
jgi:hypothetical protein